MALTTANTDNLLGKLRNFVVLLDGANSNSTLIGKADVLAAANAALLAFDLLNEYFPSAGTAGSTAVRLQSGVKSTATVTGTGTTGVTPTIVNGVVTGYVLS